MPVEIDIDHVARLARLDLTDEEKAQLREQLGVILEHAAKVGEVAADDVPPTACAIPRANVFRDDVPEPSLPADEALAQRARSRGRPVPGAPDRGDRRVTELCDLTGTELAAKLSGGEISAAEIVESWLERIDAVDDGSTRSSRRRPRSPASARRSSTPTSPPARRRAAAAGIPVALKDVLTTNGIRTTCGSRILETYVPPYDGTAWARLGGARGRAGRQDQLRRVRDGLVERELGVRAGPQPVGPRAGPGRLERRQRGRGRRR